MTAIVTYECPTCGNRIGVGIVLRVPPMCTADHPRTGRVGRRTRVMVQVEEETP